MTDDTKYTAETLAFRGGVPVRTVRFYVQEKLIDPPAGRGRAANFDEHHLSQLLQARTLQNFGFSLNDIRERREELLWGLRTMSGFDAALNFQGPGKAWAKKKKSCRKSQEEEELDANECIRIPMADGVELMVSQDKPLPSPRQLVDIALYIRKIFGQK